MAVLWGGGEGGVGRYKAPRHYKEPTTEVKGRRMEIRNRQTTVTSCVSMAGIFKIKATFLKF